MDRNIRHFLWYGEVAGDGLRSVGVSSPSKSVCSILPIARRWRAGGVFCVPTLARSSLLKPAADQQVQPPNDRQGAYHRQRCEYPEEHASIHSPLSLAVGYNRIVTHGRRPCNNVVAILAKDKISTNFAIKCATYRWSCHGRKTRSCERSGDPGTL